MLLILLLAAAVPASGAVVRWDDTRLDRLEGYARQVAQVSDLHGIQAAADSLQIWLVGEGYLDATVYVASDTLAVSPGPRYRLTGLEVESDSSYQVPHQGFFVQQEVDRGVEAALSRYTSFGHYYARATITGLIRTDSSVWVRARITPGPLVTIGEVRLLGLSRTKHDLLAKLLPVAAGDTLTDRVLAEIEEAASAVTYVTYQGPANIRPRFGYTQADIELQFAERQQFLFSGGTGYSNEPGAGFVWDIAVEANNLFGDGRNIAAQSERREKGRNLLDIEYEQPSSLLGRGLLRGKVSTRNYRDQFYEFAVSGTYELLFTPFFSAGLTLGWKRVEPVSQVGYGRAEAIVSVKQEQLDNRLNPSRGYSLHTSLGYANRNYSADSTDDGGSFNDTRAQIRAEFYQPLVSRIVGHIALDFRGLETKENFPPVSELYFLGGPGSIRGYRNEQFAARRAVLGTVEPRYRFASGYLFGFLDIAFMQQPVQTGGVVEMDESVHRGYGLGFALSDQLRSVKLSLGWNRDISFDQPWLAVQFSTRL